MSASQRIFQLLKIRNAVSSRELRNYGLYFAALLLLSYYFSHQARDLKYLIIVAMTSAIFYYADKQFFPQVKDTMNRIHFLTMPSEQWEKWLAEFIQTFFIIPLVAITPVICAISLVELLSSAYSSTSYMEGLRVAFKLYWILHPLLFFAAIYFRKSIFIKTFGSIALLAIASTLFIVALTGIFTGGEGLIIDDNNIHFMPQALSIFSHDIVKKLIFTGYCLFFWLLSYFSLAELESE